MNTLFDSNTYICLSFNEVNIIRGCCYYNHFPSFLLHLDNLLNNTTDIYLIEELETLIYKLKQLTQEEYNQLSADARSGKILFPPNYELNLFDPDIK